jgi:hypothetical protein
MKTFTLVMVVLFISISYLNSCWDKNTIIRDVKENAPFIDNENYIMLNSDLYAYTLDNNKLLINFRSGKLIERVKVIVSVPNNHGKVYKSIFRSQKLPHALTYTVPIDIETNNVNKVDVFIKSITLD